MSSFARELRSAEVRTALIAWGIYLAGASCYCLLHQAIVRASVPDPAGTIVLGLREWGVWLVATPVAFRILSRHEAPARRWPSLIMPAAAIVLAAVMFPLVIDQLTQTRSAASSLAIFLPRYVAALAVVYLVWHVFLRNGTLVDPSRHHPETLLVSKGADECLLQVRRMQYLSASGNYVEIFADGQMYLMRATMKQVEELLPPSRFIRIHRSHIVNMDAIERIRTERSGSGNVHLRCGKTLAMSRKYRAGLQKFRPEVRA
jgi:hypothetical protein